MDICSFEHEEICYESRECPLCAKIEECEDLEKTNDDLEKEKVDLESKVTELEEELDLFQDIKNNIIEL